MQLLVHWAPRVGLPRQIMIWILDRPHPISNPYHLINSSASCFDKLIMWHRRKLLILFAEIAGRATNFFSFVSICKYHFKWPTLMQLNLHSLKITVHWNSRFFHPEMAWKSLKSQHEIWSSWFYFRLSPSRPGLVRAWALRVVQNGSGLLQPGGCPVPGTSAATCMHASVQADPHRRRHNACVYVRTWPFSQNVWPLF